MQSFIFTNGHGQRFRATLNVDAETAARCLANRALRKGQRVATALEGAIAVSVEPLPEWKHEPRSELRKENWL